MSVWEIFSTTPGVTLLSPSTALEGDVLLSWYSCTLLCSLLLLFFIFPRSVTPSSSYRNHTISLLSRLFSDFFCLILLLPLHDAISFVVIALTLSTGISMFPFWLLIFLLTVVYLLAYLDILLIFCFYFIQMLHCSTPLDSLFHIKCTSLFF